ncbi:Restriction of telomere capping protein 5 [Orbilia oligospora]|uniref:Restriction of telomere capping protein 5 n=1 Tax=Orbilia oligospora TaxID=2813651 RepID=A0A7C8NHK2_ORBOL|nr:Restriction of telomere capping protein 5 [Orbilia oligospora]KAF3082386.1 Restriction of telomere capping protein 5 [Orbilia oligospora]
MGQSQSDETRRSLSPDDLRHRLTHRLQKRTFTDLELYSFRDVFASLANTSNDGTIYWSQDTLTRFLELPDALDVTNLLYHATSIAAGFPFLSDGPGVLDWEAVVRVVCVFTGRYKTVLRKGGGDAVRVWFRILAVHDRGGNGGCGNDVHVNGKGIEDAIADAMTNGRGHGKHGDDKNDDNADNADDDDDDSDDIFRIADPEDMEDENDDDELALAALEALDAIEVFKLVEKPAAVVQKYVRRLDPKDLTKLVMLLLVIAPLDPQESLATYVERYSGDALVDLRRAAESIVRSMSIDGKPILWTGFSKSIKRSLPHLFDGFKPLYEHFLFSKRLNMNKNPSLHLPLTPPLLQHYGTILTPTILNQLSFFLKGETLYRRLRKLYIGSDDGFSMGMFEQKVFKWRAPTILLVSGSRMGTPSTSREKSFSDSLSPKRFPDSITDSNDDDNETLTFGVYIDVMWKITHKECFGTSDTQIFQLHPIHEVFETSKAHSDYIYWNKSAGIGFGAPLPRIKAGDPVLHMNLGAVSLILDESLEFGVFTHSSSGGGAYHTSDLGVGGRSEDWQERFNIEEIEVWGVGGEEEAKEQARQWAWDEAEAMRRRNVQLGDDVEANRALLEMAGIIGGNRSGGSM